MQQLLDGILARDNNKESKTIWRIYCAVCKNIKISPPIGPRNPMNTEIHTPNDAKVPTKKTTDTTRGDLFVIFDRDTTCKTLYHRTPCRRNIAHALASVKRNRRLTAVCANHNKNQVGNILAEISSRSFRPSTSAYVKNCIRSFATFEHHKDMTTRQNVYFCKSTHDWGAMSTWTNCIY